MAETVLEYQSPCDVYALEFSHNPLDLKLGVGSFTDAAQAENSITICAHDASSGSLKPIARHSLQYPCTSLAFSPLKLTQTLPGSTSGAPNSGPASRELVATSSECLRIWDLSPEHVSRRGSSGSTGEHIGQHAPQQLSWRLLQRAALVNSKADYSAPLTSFSWSEIEPSLIVTSSIDTTCTIWDIAKTTAITQLIAHDREVYDVAWSPSSRDVFVSVGADGSVRAFDVRSLEHSTILFEASGPASSASSSPQTPSSVSGPAPGTPLLRLAFNPADPNYLSILQAGSSDILMLDIRSPGAPVAELRGHRSGVNGLAWGHAAKGGNLMASCGDDCQVIVWDTSNLPEAQPAPTKGAAPAPLLQPDPYLAWTASGHADNIAWSSPSAAGQEYIAAAHGRTVTAHSV